MPYVKICDVCNTKVEEGDLCSLEKSISVTFPISQSTVSVLISIRESRDSIVLHKQCYHTVLRMAADNITPDGHI